MFEVGVTATPEQAPEGVDVGVGSVRADRTVVDVEGAALAVVAGLAVVVVVGAAVVVACIVVIGAVAEVVIVAVGGAVVDVVGETVGVVVAPLLSTVKFPRRLDVVPSDRVNTALMVCDPSASFVAS
jgi:hypothetical protein